MNVALTQKKCFVSCDMPSLDRGIIEVADLCRGFCLWLDLRRKSEEMGRVRVGAGSPTVVGC